MTKLSDMLQLYRRHSRTCPHRKKGRAYTKCRCMIHADGELSGKRFRGSTSVRGLATRAPQAGCVGIAGYAGPQTRR